MCGTGSTRTQQTQALAELVMLAITLASLTICPGYAKVVSRGLPLLPHLPSLDNNQLAGAEYNYPVYKVARPTYSPNTAHYDDPYEYENYIPKKYDFHYAVKDIHSGDNFSHRERKTDSSTEGEYRVLLPDGRVQIVSYTADAGGYHATVEYQGESHQEETQNIPKLPDSLTNNPSSQYHQLPPTSHHHNPSHPTQNYTTHKYRYSPTIDQYQEQLNHIKPSKHAKKSKKYKYSPYLAPYSEDKDTKHHKSITPPQPYKYSPLIGSASQPITPAYKKKNIKSKAKIVLKKPKPLLPLYTPEDTEPFKQKPAITLEDEEDIAH